MGNGYFLVFNFQQKKTFYESIPGKIHQNNKMVAHADSESCARILKALADDSRLRILEFLFDGEFSVSEIADNTGIEYSQTSHHLGVLRNAGLVLDCEEGQFVIYKLHPLFYNRNDKRRNILDFDCCSIEFGSAKFIRNRET